MSLENSSVTVSIVCTVYNKGKWLAQTIDSLLVQKDVILKLLLLTMLQQIILKKS